jgi:hypothetical protein
VIDSSSHDPLDHEGAVVDNSACFIRIEELGLSRISDDSRSALKSEAREIGNLTLLAALARCLLCGGNTRSFLLTFVD